MSSAPPAPAARSETPAPTAPARATLDRTGRIAVLVALVFAPVAIGTVHRETLAVLELLVGVAALAAIANRRGRPWALPTPVLALTAAVVALGLVRLVPLPPSVVTFLSPTTASWYSTTAVGGTAGAWKPLSLAPGHEWIVLGRALTYLLFFLLLTNLYRTAARRRIPLVVLATMGGASLLVGALHTLTGAERMLGVYTLRDLAPYPFMATFANPNFQAGFYGMASLVALGIALSHDTKGRMRAAMGAASAAAFVGAYLTLSRSAMVLLPASGALAVLLSRRGRTDTRRTLVVTGVLAWTAAALLVASTDAGRELLTLVPWSDAADWSKTDVWRRSLAVIGDFWTFGVGRGAFGSALLHYAPGTGSIGRNVAVENELLQALVDHGVVGGLGVLGLTAWATLSPVDVRRVDGCTAGVTAALFFVVAQNVVDFNLDSPGCVLPAIVLVGTLWTRRGVRGDRATPGDALDAGRPVNRCPRIPAVAVAVLTGVCLLSAGLTWAGRRHTLEGDRATLAALSRTGMSEATVTGYRAEALQRHPIDHQLYTLSAEHALRSGSPPGEALRWVNKALFLFSRAPSAHFVAAEALMGAGRRDQAMIEYRIALSDTVPVEGRRRIFSRLLHWRASDAELVHVARDEHELPLLVVLLRREQAARARTLVDTLGLLASAHDDSTLGVVARTLWAVRDIGALSALLSRAGERTALTELYGGRVARHSGDAVRALAHVESGMLLAPTAEEQAALLSEEAVARRLLGDVQGLTRLLDRDDLPPRLRAAVYFGRGLAHAGHGEPRSAVNDFRVARGLRPDWAAPLEHTARLWEKLGEWDRALATYEALVDLAPAHENGLRGRERSRRERDAARLRLLATPGSAP